MTAPLTPARDLLERVYRKAVADARPDRAVRMALESRPMAGLPAHHEGASRLHLLALGKAADPMLEAALAWSARVGPPQVSGVRVGPPGSAAPVPDMAWLVGDHPTPGAQSMRAALAIGRYVESQVQQGDAVLVLLSGGTSAMLGAPLAGIDVHDFAQVSDALLGAGLPIADINLVRRRFLRWGGGRLGAAIVSRGARVRCLVVSDVVQGPLTAIGSGPCAPDDASLEQVRTVIARAASLGTHERTLLTDWCFQLQQGLLPDVPARHDPRFLHVQHEIVASNETLRTAAVRHAGLLGVAADGGQPPMLADAHQVGEAIVQTLLARRARSGTMPDRPPQLTVWGGEPTVSLAGCTRALGGRMQALALSAAHALHRAGTAADGLTLLCAGSDGRDGPTDAAGAVVDNWTWGAITAGGRVPATDLAERRSYLALDAVDALIRSWGTGTNVNDIVLALDDPRGAGGA